jgi:hypothetical protein
MIIRRQLSMSPSMTRRPRPLSPANGTVMFDAPAACAIHLRHIILISTASPKACLKAVSSVVYRVGGDVSAFSLKPAGSRFEAVLRLVGIDDAGAERVAAMIAAWPDAGSVRTEHQWGRP